MFQNADPLCTSMVPPMLLLSHVYVVLYRCKIPLMDGKSKNIDGLSEVEGGRNMKLE